MLATANEGDSQWSQHERRENVKIIGKVTLTGKRLIVQHVAL